MIGELGGVGCLMKKLFLLGLVSLGLIACSRTENPDNRAGKIDMTKPVDYLVVSSEEKDKALYILTGESTKTEDGVEDEEGQDIEAEETDMEESEEVTE